MTEVRINMYEGMFLFPQAAGADLGGAVAHVESILERADAELVSISKWDERRLAYDIKGNKRGVYLLTYFTADRSRIAGIERDCNLSEELLRARVVRADHVPAEEVEAANGREAIADEIKLRAERGEEESRPKVTATSREALKAEEAAKADVADEEAPTEEAPDEEAPASETENETAENAAD
ncbi:MAG: 30S ribosomal protein S6 [Planctomycetota bacterium]|nr:30S ribosomal protein S6 [Planctomycetota bacterium]